MKKFEIRKASAEIKMKDRLSIAEGCAYEIDEEPKVIISDFTSLAAATELLGRYKSTIAELSSPVGRYYLVEEYYIEGNEYDDDDEWIGGGDVWSFSPMTISVVDDETDEVVQSFNNMKDAVNFFEDCVGGDFEPRLTLN